VCASVRGPEQRRDLVQRSHPQLHRQLAAGRPVRNADLSITYNGFGVIANVDVNGQAGATGEYIGIYGSPQDKLYWKYASLCPYNRSACYSAAYVAAGGQDPETALALGALDRATHPEDADIGAAIPDTQVDTIIGGLVSLGAGEAASPGIDAAAGLLAGIGPSEEGAASADGLVLGKYPDYTRLANELGARQFSIPEAAYQAMTTEEQWAANQAVLDQAIADRIPIVLSNPATPEFLTGSFGEEIAYLIKQGYEPGPGAMTMVPRGS
jgi:hypothetical protein